MITAVTWRNQATLLACDRDLDQVRDVSSASASTSHRSDKHAPPRRNAT